MAQAAFTSITVPGQENLVAWYKLNESAGKTAKDSVTNTTFPVLKGNWSKGKGGGLSSPHILVGNRQEMSFTRGFTLAARVKLKGGYGVIIGSYEAGGLVVSPESIKVVSWGSDWHTEGLLPEDTWLHITLTSSDANPGVNHVYINGKLLASGKGRPEWPLKPKDWTIGAWENGGEPFPGTIADVMVYNTELSDEKVGELAASFGLNGPI